MKKLPNELWSPNKVKIFGKGQLSDNEFTRLVIAIDNLMSSIAEYDSEYYSNGEMNLHYKCGNWNIMITINDEEV